MTLARLWGFLAVALPVLGALLANLQSVDLAYHLRAGGLILDTRAIPATDPFTFTAAGQPWQDQQWGAEAILALVYRAAGWSGLVVVRAGLIGVLFGFVFDMCRRGTSARIGALLTLASFGLASVTLALRPQLFGMVLFAAILWLVTRRHERPNRTWLVVPLTLVWANLHGSFVLGPLVVGLAFVEDALDPGTRVAARRTLLLALAAAAATLVNPFGFAVWQYAAGIVTNPLVTTRITEWQPTTPASVEGAAFYGSVGLVVLLLVATAVRRGRIDVAAAIWLAPFAAIGARAVRGLAWWPLVAAVLVARLIARSPAAGTPSERVDPPVIRRLNVVVATAIVIACVVLLPIWRAEEAGLRAPAGVVGTAPPGITAALRDMVGPSDRLFAPQPWGSWFEFSLPETPVFIDSRIELFPVDVWDDYDTITDGRAGWQATLDRWSVTVVVAVDRLGAVPLSGRLVGDPKWRQVYTDSDGQIFVRGDRPG